MRVPVPVTNSNQVQIITRGTRSLGYGFVEFATLEDAEKAAKELDKTQIADRTVNVEIAKPPPATTGSFKKNVSLRVRGTGAGC
jgi:RNA recognition motif-containing protein